MPTTDMYGGDNAFWGTQMNTSGVMGFVDKFWILLNRIFTILLIIMVVLVAIGIIAGTSALNKSGFTASKFSKFVKSKL